MVNERSGPGGSSWRGDRGRAAVAWVHDVPIPLLVLTAEGIVDANRAALVELDTDAEATMGTALFARVEPPGLEALLDAVDGAPPATADAARVTIGIGPASGRGASRYVELRLHGAEGAAGVAIALVIDVTEQYRLDSAVAGLANATVALDASANMTWRPFGNARRFSVADEEALGAPVLEWMHPDELPHMLEVFAGLLAEPGARRTELIRMRHPYVEDGWLMSRVTGVNLLDDPAMRAVVVRTEDAAPVDLVDDLTHTTGPFRSLAEVTPVGIVVTDRDGSILYRNGLARELLGLDRTLPDGTAWLANLPTSAAAQLQSLLTDARDEQRYGTVVVELDHERTSSTSSEDERTATWLRVDVVPQVDERGSSFGMVATLLDVTAETEARQQLADAQDRLWHLATHDPLTGLANRVLFLERLAAALEERASGGEPVALLYGDLDGFKPVNDLHGHTVGDAVLRIVAQRMTQAIRSTDVVGRFGGDEFLVLCPGFSANAEIEALAARLVEVVRQPMAIGALSVRVGMTVGIAFAGQDTVVDDLIIDADNAMYAGKAALHRL